MTRLIVRHVLLLGLAFVVSWWVVFNDPAEPITRQPQVPGEILVALEALASDVAGDTPPALEAVAPESTVSEADAAEANAPQEASQEDELEEQPAPPPPELGSPLAEEQDKPRAASPGEESADEQAAATEGSSSAAEAEALMVDPSLLEAAALEIGGRGRKGFATELIAAPEDQLDIARTFGEELVLIPFRSVAPEATDHSWFRIAMEGAPEVQRMNSEPPLSDYRQYRDLFDYEYSQLPSPLRELRRAVLSRNEVYLFAALIPPREWALVIGRRRQALAQSGRSVEDVRTFRIRYRSVAGSGFDVQVVEIIFADGSRFKPDGAAGRVGTTADRPSLQTKQSQ